MHGVPAKAIRVAGATVAPGTSARVTLGRARLAVRVIVGATPGPRVAVVAGWRTRADAAILAAEALATLDPARLKGVLGVAPLFAARTAAGPMRGLRFPGRVDGHARERDAFALYSALVVDADLVLALDAAPPAHHALSCARFDPADARARRLAGAAGFPVALPASSAHPILSGVHAARTTALLLRVGRDATSATDGAETLLAAAQRVLAAAGVLAPSTPPGAHRVTLGSTETVARAPRAGILRPRVEPGERVSRNAALADLMLPGGGAVDVLRAPTAGFVLERRQAGLVKKGARVVVLGAPSPAHALAGARRGAGAQGREDQPIVCGWAERIALPELGVTLRAKVDTGARTSALHVVGAKVVGTTSGPRPRPILEFGLPGRPKLRVRAEVHDHVVVRDSGGRSERRPVIETSLLIGPLRRRIRLTLTDRGDMLFPMLVGRTALGDGIVVDPSHRDLVRPTGPSP